MATTTQGSRSPDISYAGSNLASSSTYYWRIKFSDDDRKEGAWSTATSTFSLAAGTGTNLAPTAPTSLQTEGQTNPTNITDNRPEFSAIYNDPDNGDLAPYYRIQVSTTSLGNWSHPAPFWDSGTTTMATTTQGNRSPNLGHAVMELNKEDDGKRSFILCTNNENGICEEVTYPRVKKIISGYKNSRGKSITGLGGSLKYFKTKFVKKNTNGDDFKIRITNECTEMLCLREGVFDEIKKTNHYRIFQHGDKTLAVYYSFERKLLPTLKKELEKIEGEKILYCFTLDPTGLSKTEFANWHGVTLEPIPQKVLDVYKQIYEY